MSDYRHDGTLPGHHAKVEPTGDMTTRVRAEQRGAADRGEHPQSDHRRQSETRTLGPGENDHVGRLERVEAKLDQLIETLKRHRLIA